jgi:hypothetical protein
MNTLNSVSKNSGAKQRSFPCRELLIPTTQKERKLNSQVFLLGAQIELRC